MRHPTTLYVGGTLHCGRRAHGATGVVDCPPAIDDLTLPGVWAARSTDGGLTWSQLTESLGLAPEQDFPITDVNAEHPCIDTVDPFVVADDGRHLYTDFGASCGTPDSTVSAILRSADRGNHWKLTPDDCCGESGYYYGLLAPSPFSPRRLYAVEGNEGGWLVVVSNDAGETWMESYPPVPKGTPEQALPHFQILGVVADSRQPNTLYANINPSGGNDPTLVMRSTDLGHTWATVMKPAVSPPLRTFAVSTDPHEPGLLVGRTFDHGIPTNRRYLSGDQGRTWRVAACPGTHGGLCPAFTFDSVFGNGASYALFGHTLYSFRDGGPAGARLAISSRLPAGTVIDAGAGVRSGDPAYLLVRGSDRTVSGLLYRSTDGGKIWQRLPAGVLPNLAPPSTAPGTLLVPATHHSVAAPFVATYHRLDPRVIGYPLTEAYNEGDTLTQVFEHLRLEVHGGTVVVGTLGRDLFIYGECALVTPEECGGEGGVGPIPNSPTARYFPSTHHTLRGDLLRFWQRHGGMAVFGAPISEVVTGTNGDGSGRKYQMQYFANARLERHPENRNPRYAIELGLLGSDWLQAQGWQ